MSAIEMWAHACTPERHRRARRPEAARVSMDGRAPKECPHRIHRGVQTAFGEATTRCSPCLRRPCPETRAVANRGRYSLPHSGLLPRDGKCRCAFARRWSGGRGRAAPAVRAFLRRSYGAGRLGAAGQPRCVMQDVRRRTDVGSRDAARPCLWGWRAVGARLAGLRKPSVGQLLHGRPSAEGMPAPLQASKPRVRICRVRSASPSAEARESPGRPGCGP
jgi:hypothetical protein